MKETFKAFDQARSEGWFIGYTFKIIFVYQIRFSLLRRAYLEFCRLHDQARAEEGGGKQEGDLHKGEATQDVCSCPEVTRGFFDQNLKLIVKVSVLETGSRVGLCRYEH